MPAASSPRKPPVPRRKRVSDDRILDAACAELVRTGFEGAALDRIAAAAGISRVTLYARFTSKPVLFKAVHERESAELERRLLAAYAADERLPLAERLHRYVAAYFEFGRDRPDGFRLLFLNELLPAGLQSTIDLLTQRIAELFAHGDGREDPGPEDRFTATLIIGAVHHGAGAAAAGGEISADVATTITERFLTSGVRMTLGDLR